MTYNIFDASPQAKQLIQSDVGEPTTINFHWRVKYPFDELEIGKSFCVPFKEVKELAIRNIACVRGKKTSKKFTVVKHPQYEVFEVARVG